MNILNISSDKLDQFCQEHGACQEGIDWLKGRDLRKALEDCPRPEWIEWFVSKLPNTDAMDQYFDSTEAAYRAYAAGQRKAKSVRNALLEDATLGYSEKADRTYDDYSEAIRTARSVQERDKIITRRTRALDAAYSELELTNQRAQEVYEALMRPTRQKFLDALKASMTVFDIDERGVDGTNKGNGTALGESAGDHGQ